MITNTSVTRNSMATTALYGCLIFCQSCPIGVFIQYRLQHFGQDSKMHNHRIPTRPSGTDLGKGSKNTYARHAYWCLSYIWGNGNKTCLIMINGRPYLVHQNLWDLLDFVRQRFEKQGGFLANHAKKPTQLMPEPLLWIDAICINQDDTVEKNHQVQQMGRIYASADWVLIWLGRSCASSITFSRIHCLRQHEYWSRAWITQEVALARLTYVCVNAKVQALGELIRDIESGSSGDDPDSHWDEEAEIAFDLLSAYFRLKTTAGVTPRNVFHLLDAFGVTKRCANVMDRIYSLLALASDHNITVDYALLPRQLFRHIVLGRRIFPCLYAIFITAKALGIGPPLNEEASDFDDLDYSLEQSS